MIYGVTLGEKHSYNDLGLLLNSSERPLPTAKTETVEIDGRDGVLDLTGVMTNGNVKFKNRTLKLQFTLLEGDFETKKSELGKLFHAKKIRVVFDDDPNFYYYGRIDMNSWKVVNNYRTFTFNIDCEPYKYELEEYTQSVEVGGSSTATNSISIEDTISDNLIDLKTNGNSTQNTLSGKNLFNFNYLKNTACTNGTKTFTDNSITITSKANDCYDNSYMVETFRIPVLPNTEYTLSFNRDTEVSGNTYIFEYASDGTRKNNVKSSSDLKEMFTITTSSTTVSINVRVGIATSGQTCTFSNFQIEKGSLTEYEPYCGGIPSPNPDYPQEIKSVKNPKITVCGKNIINKNGYVLNVKTKTNSDELIANLNVQNGKKYYCSVDQDVNLTSDTRNTFYIVYSDGTRVYELVGENANLNKGRRSFSFTAKCDDENVMLRYWCHTPSNELNLSNFMVSKIEDMTYEPYQSQTVTLPYNLYSKNEYRDFIEYDNGKWYLNRLLSDVITYDGSDDESWTTDSSGNYYYSGVKKTDALLKEDEPTQISNRYTSVVYVTDLGTLKEGSILINANYYVILGVDKTKVATVEALKSYLASNPITVQYVMATPTKTDITDEVNTILSTYDNVTNIMITNDDNVDTAFSLDYCNKQDVNLENLSQWVEPKTVSKGNITLTKGNVKYKLTNGTSYPFMIEDGDNNITVSGKGTVIFSYKRGEL